MEPDEIDYEQVHDSLMNQYLANGKESVLKKILNLNPEKKKLKPIENGPKYYMKNFHPKLHTSQKLLSNSNMIPDTRLDTDIRKFDFYDPLYKEKQMKGSSKWATQRLNVMKINIAKRYSAPIDSIQFPRKEYGSGNKQILNANLLTEEKSVSYNDNHKNGFPLKPIKNKIRKVETKYRSDNPLSDSMPILSKKTCNF